MIYALMMMADVFAATESRAPLWNELNAGDTPEVVGEKLAKLPEVTKIKVKPSKKAEKEPDVDINLAGQGYVILDDAYQINPVFNGGTLKSLRLDTGQTCRNTVFARYSALLDALKTKYPDVAHEGFEPKDRGAFLQAEIDHLNGKKGRISSALTNGETTVYVTLEVLTIARPAITYGGNAITRALNDLQWSIYRTQEQACGGTGDQAGGAFDLLLRFRRFQRDDGSGQSKHRRREGNSEGSAVDQFLRVLLRSRRNAAIDFASVSFWTLFERR